MTKEEMLQRINRFKPLNSVLDYKIYRLFLHYPFKLAYYYAYKKLVYLKTKKGKLKTVYCFFGQRMNILLPASLDIFFFGLKPHPSEIALAKYLLLNLQEGDCMLDIGAHFGYFTLLASTIVGHKGKVMAFEPSLENFQVLTVNTASHKNVYAENAAVSDHDGGKVEFRVFPAFRSELNTINTGQYNNSPWFNEEQGKVIEVPTRSLNRILLDTKERVKIIKIDVEGAEGLVIKGGLDALRQNSNTTLILECLNDNTGSGSRLLPETLLHSIGFQPHYIKSDGTLDKIKTPILDFMKARNLVSENIVFKKTGSIS